MPENRPRRPLADGLSRACFDGDLASVQQYLAEGADLLAPRPARGPAKQCMDSTDSVFLAIHECSLFARADCLTLRRRGAAATGLPDRVRCAGACLVGPRFAASGHADEQAVISGASSVTVTLASWGLCVMISSNEHTSIVTTSASSGYNKQKRLKRGELPEDVPREAVHDRSSISR